MAEKRQSVRWRPSKKGAPPQFTAYGGRFLKNFMYLCSPQRGGRGVQRSCPVSCQQQCECEWRSRLCECEQRITYTPEDGKKRFPGKAVRLSAIVNKEIEIHDYEKDVKTSQGEGRYIVSFKDAKTGEWAKFFTASEEMKQILDKASDIEDCFPFTTVIESEVFDGNKVKYRFT